jgi:hypothetical protein
MAQLRRQNTTTLPDKELTVVEMFPRHQPLPFSLVNLCDSGLGKMAF